jgi:hypothetical protein
MAAFKKSLLFTKICILGVSLLIKINSPWLWQINCEDLVILHLLLELAVRCLVPVMHNEEMVGPLDDVTILPSMCRWYRLRPCCLVCEVKYWASSLTPLQHLFWSPWNNNYLLMHLWYIWLWYSASIVVILVYLS